MTKKEFLKRLEERLSILNSSERKDIIDEYKDTINEKIKHGQTENDAINDFGDIDELVEGILSAYKINPEYYQPKENIGEEFIKDGESLIKEYSHKLANFSRNLFDSFKNNTKGLTIELIFEILIKILVFMIIIGILKLPFYIIGELGEKILKFNLSPIDELLGLIWNIIVGVVYFIVSILIGISMFSRYFNKDELEDEINNKKENKIELKKETKKKEKNQEIRKENNVKKDNGDSTIVKTFILIVKLFIFVILLLPMLGTIIAGVCAFSATIYLLIKGFDVIGITLLILGGTFIASNIYNVLWNLLYGHKKMHFFLAIVGLIMVIVGLFMTFDMVTKFEVYDQIPKGVYSEKTQKFNENISAITTIDDYSNDLEIIVDNNLKDGETIIEVTYFDEVIDVYIDKHQYENNNIYSILYDSKYNRRVIDNILSDIKDYKIYNYDKLDDYHTKVYVNENTRSLVKRSYN